MTVFVSVGIFSIDSMYEALLFIDTNLSWDMNNETVADFIKLLEKRYI